ncbi:MAG: sigma-70 family RNA polymerase sigma factor [Myxococcota bacterium]
MARSDFELLDAWRAGDASAADALLQRHFATLRRFFRNKVSTGAEDLIQRTLLKCVERRDRYPSAWSFRRYVLVAARDQLYEHLRKHSGVNFDASVRSLHDLGSSPSAAAARRERHQLLHEALRRIPVELQVALELYYWEELRAKDLAEILELPVGTVRSRLRRRLEQLREQIGLLSDSGTDPTQSIDEVERWSNALRDDT